jgi:hypothetical protein
MPAGAPPPKPAAAPAVAVARAIAGADTLSGLLARVADSRRRFETIVPLLPPALCADVQPGPLDDAQWQILATNAAAASKLRQLAPALQAALDAAGWPAAAVLKIKVLPRR